VDASTRRWTIFAVTAGVVAALVALIAPFYALHHEGSPYRRAMEEASRPQQPAAPSPTLVEATAHVRTFAAHARAGRYEAAYALMTRAYRSGVPLRRFREAIAANPYLTKADDVSLYRLREVGGTRQAEGVLATGAGPVAFAAFEALDEGVWRLTGLQLGGTPALPGP
jgi:hypothetical protein